MSGKNFSLGGLFTFEQFLGFLDNPNRGFFLDIDRTRFFLFGHFAHQIDAQDAVIEVRAFHHDVIGELELSDEIMPGNAPVQVMHDVVFGFLLADDGEGVLFGFDVHLVFVEPG